MRRKRELEQRTSQLKNIFAKRKSLRQLFCEHKTFFEDYRKKWIFLHLKELMENLDDLLVTDSKLIQFLVNTEI